MGLAGTAVLDEGGGSAGLTHYEPRWGVNFGAELSGRCEWGAIRGLIGVRPKDTVAVVSQQLMIRQGGYVRV